MIPKGNQRGGGQQLATHLMNSFDNDRVEIVEVRGAVANDLHGAFAEWYAQSKATHCRQYLYHLMINPDHRQGPFTRADYDDFIRRAEKKLRLGGQPYAIVFHVKKGREHCHVVWSRINVEKGKAVHLDNDHQKLRRTAQEFARDHDLRLPPGMSNDRGAARFAFNAAAENLAEKQQQERSSISKRERREAITKAWTESKDANTFIRALETSGFLLARGDQRPYVVVDMAGEVHSLSRQLIGVKAEGLKARLSSLDIDRLLTAADAQAYAGKKRQALLLDKERKESAARKITLGQRAEAAKTEAQRRRDELAKAHAARRAPLEEERSRLAARHEAERKALAEMQAAKTQAVAAQRAAKQPTGVLAFLARITGYNAVTAWRHERQDRQSGAEFKAQKDALARRHEREMENFRHRESGLTALDKRERRSLETTLRREVFNRIASPQKQPEKDRAETQRQKLADIKQTAAEVTAPPQSAKRSQDAVKESPAPVPSQPPKDLKPVFTEAAGSKTTPEAELTDAQRRALELKRAFNRRAAGRERDREGGKDREHYRRPPPDFTFRR